MNRETDFREGFSSASRSLLALLVSVSSAAEATTAAAERSGTSIEIAAYATHARGAGVGVSWSVSMSINPCAATSKRSRLLIVDSSCSSRAGLTIKRREAAASTLRSLSVGRFDTQNESCAIVPRTSLRFDFRPSGSRP